LPFSVEWVTVPVLALGPWNLAEVWPIPEAKVRLAVNIITASEATEIICLRFIEVSFLVYW
jgi:hypothetical protein